MADKIWKPHTTVAAVCEREGSYLLVRERVGKREVYNQPAGHLEVGESLLEAVIRETAELSVNGTRRRALVLQFAQLAARRLQALSDPERTRGSLEGF